MTGGSPECDDTPASATISSDEVILKRLPARPHTVKQRPGIGLTATSYALGPRPGERFPSYSRQRITSPARLLELAAAAGQNVSGWSVAAIRVANVRQLGLDVVSRPTDEDPGHCEIVPTEQQRFTDTVWSRLAKQAPVVLTRR